MTQEYPCWECRDEVANEDNSIQCDLLCDQWNHIELRIKSHIKLKSFLNISKTSATPTQVTSKTNLQTK